MPYIGTSPSNGVRRVHTYTATASQTTFTGASSEGVTLSYADTNYLDVFQNGVLLGSADYTSTSGTSVVLAQGASADDLVVIVVYDVFSVADTVSKTAGGSFDSGVSVSGDLTVDTSTLKVDSSNNRVGVGTTSPSDPLHVTASSGSRMARFEASQANSFIAFKDSNTNVMPTIGCTTDALELKTASSGDPALGLKIDSNGHVTMPKQSAFLVKATAQNNIANGTTLLWGTEIFDQNGDFSSNAFTAPVTGKYHLSWNIRLVDLDNAASYIVVRMETSNRNIDPIIDIDEFSSDVTYYTIGFDLLLDMDANDTASVVYIQSGGSTVVDNDANHSHFSGYLVC